MSTAAIDPVMSTELFIGVVTVLYHSESVVEGFIDSLASNAELRPRLRVYAIDNTPTRTGLDRLEQLARTRSVDVRAVFNDRNVGVAAGNNQGIRLALADRCTHVLLANNDIEFDARAIPSLLEGLDRTRSAAAVPKILYHGTRTIWYGGGSFNWKADTPHAGLRQPDEGQCDTEGATGDGPSCFMLVESAPSRAWARWMNATSAITTTPISSGDCMSRALQLLYVPRAVVLHKVSTSSGGALRHLVFAVSHESQSRVLRAQALSRVRAPRGPRRHALAHRAHRPRPRAPTPTP